ncbi:ROK family protein [Stratiformator vulcanicus]|uniref:N-acetylmannosamine kinase n=1 Tax=Stratiformator vulcanicus TaxID=2527980 RepID=A0A517QYL1_9PLAN|nr:ROK family protein [Stratiformator vulcanicus]QDT36630.1 N-acetylmannosamine kinase [Stratiformator vulcanicus]
MSVYAGIDLGGTTITAALGRADGEIVARQQIDTDGHLGPDSVIERMAELIERLATQAGERPDGIGIGLPGLVDVHRGVTKFLPNLPTQWREIALATRLKERFEVPVRLLNDARAATLAELVFGIGRTVDTFAFFTLGTGVGGGVVIDGKLRLGPLGAAGELGHQTVQFDGPRCGCGNRGCLETVASGSAIIGEAVRLLKTGFAPRLHDAIDGDAGQVTPKRVAEAIAAGDEQLAGAIDRVGGYLGIAAANIVTSLHPQAIVYGGGVAAMGDLLFEPVRREIRDRVGMFPTGDILVVRSELEEDAGLLGAIALAAGHAVE